MTPQPHSPITGAAMQPTSLLGLHVDTSPIRLTVKVWDGSVWF